MDTLHLECHSWNYTHVTLSDSPGARARSGRPGHAWIERVGRGVRDPENRSNDVDGATLTSRSATVTEISRGVEPAGGFAALASVIVAMSYAL